MARIELVAMVDYNHPDHGNIVSRTVDAWMEDEDVYYCERCHVMVPQDNPEQFDQFNCDEYHEVRKGAL